MALTQRLCPRACRHAVIGRRFYDYYDLCCRPSLHCGALLRRLGLKPSFSQRRRRPRYDGPSPGKAALALSSPTHLYYRAGLRKGLGSSVIMTTYARSRVSRDHPRPALIEVRFRLGCDFGYGFLQIPHWQAGSKVVSRFVEPRLFHHVPPARFFGHPCLRLLVTSSLVRDWTFTN